VCRLDSLSPLPTTCPNDDDLMREKRRDEREGGSWFLSGSCFCRERKKESGDDNGGFVLAEVSFSLQRLSRRCLHFPGFFKIFLHEKGFLIYAVQIVNILEIVEIMLSADTFFT
jgi:hypothetical protein